MKRILFAAAATAMLASSASAFSVDISLPNLTFPPASDVSVQKDCIDTDATSDACITQE